MSIFNKIKSTLKHHTPIQQKDVVTIKKGLLSLNNMYQTTSFDLTSAQKCSYYSLNVSESSKISEIIFFCHEIASMYASDFSNFREALNFYNLALEYVNKEKYTEQIDERIYMTSLIAKSLYSLGDYQKSLESYIKAKSIIDESGEGLDSLQTIVDSIKFVKNKIESLR